MKRIIFALMVIISGFVNGQSVSVHGGWVIFPPKQKPFELSVADLVFAVQNVLNGDTSKMWRTLPSGNNYQLLHPTVWLDLVIESYHARDNSVNRTNIANAITYGEATYWDDNVSGTVKNFYWSTKFNKVSSLPGYNGGGQNPLVPIMLFNGGQTVKRNCWNPLIGQDLQENKTFANADTNVVISYDTTKKDVVNNEQVYWIRETRSEYRPDKFGGYHENVHVGEYIVYPNLNNEVVYVNGQNFYPDNNWIIPSNYHPTYSGNGYHYEPIVYDHDGGDPPIVTNSNTGDGHDPPINNGNSNGNTNDPPIVINSNNNNGNGSGSDPTIKRANSVGGRTITKSIGTSIARNSSNYSPKPSANTRTQPMNNQNYSTKPNSNVQSSRPNNQTYSRPSNVARTQPTKYSNYSRPSGGSSYYAPKTSGYSYSGGQKSFSNSSPSRSMNTGGGSFKRR